MRSDHRGLGVPNLDFNLKAWEATRDSERGNSGSDLPERGLGSRVERGGLLSGQQQGGDGTGRESSPALRRSRGRGEGGWKLTRWSCSFTSICAHTGQVLPTVKHWTLSTCFLNQVYEHRCLCKHTGLSS